MTLPPNIMAINKLLTNRTLRRTYSVNSEEPYSEEPYSESVVGPAAAASGARHSLPRHQDMPGTLSAASLSQPRAGGVARQRSEAGHQFG